MLIITVPETEFFDNQTQTFIKSKETELALEHSLVSLSKWESKWKKPFLSKNEKTSEELIDYIRCMTITQRVPAIVYLALGYNQELINKITDYINDPMTATTISEHGPRSAQRQVVTSEVIYSWMIQFNIPVEFQKWHLNRLMMLIRVCEANNSKPRKMSRKEAAQYQAKLNAERRRKYGKG